MWRHGAADVCKEGTHLVIRPIDQHPFEDIQVASCRHCLQKIPSDELTPSPQGLCLEHRLGTFHDDGQVKEDPLQGRKCL